MKMRIKGNSLRLRISQTEMKQLLREGRIDETIRFAPEADARLTYALEHGVSDREIGLRYHAQEVAIVLSTAAVKRWAEGDDVGIYGEAETGDGTVTLLVEKDFACLDGDDPQDADAFPNPKAGVVC